MKRKDFYIFIAWVQYFGNATGIFKKMKETFFDLLFLFLHKDLRFTAQQGKGEVISLTPLYHIHSLQRHLDISWAITAESSPLY